MASNALPVTPSPGLISTIPNGGTAVGVLPANINGGFITNPLSAGDQGLSQAEPLYINPIGNATLTARGSTFALQPGQTWYAIPGQSTPTTANAASSGHRFACASY